MERTTRRSIRGRRSGPLPWLRTYPRSPIPGERPPALLPRRATRSLATNRHANSWVPTGSLRHISATELANADVSGKVRAAVRAIDVELASCHGTSHCFSPHGRSRLHSPQDAPSSSNPLRSLHFPRCGSGRSPPKQVCLTASSTSYPGTAILPGRRWINHSAWTRPHSD